MIYKISASFIPCNSHYLQKASTSHSESVVRRETRDLKAHLFPSKVHSDERRLSSMIIETGFSELRTDAHWWHGNTDPKTKTNILIHAERSHTWAIIVEIWEEVEPPRRSNHARPSPTIKCTQTVRIESGMVFGGERFSWQWSFPETCLAY